MAWVWQYTFSPGESSIWTVGIVVPVMVEFMGNLLWVAAPSVDLIRPGVHLLPSGGPEKAGKKHSSLDPPSLVTSAFHMQKTLIIFKPDCMTQHHVGAVLERFERAGFNPIGAKMLRLTPALLRAHYAHVADKPFYPEIEQFMSSSPVIVMALSGEEIVQKVRDLLGPTDSRKAAKGTIRGDFGTDMMKNVVHASDSDDNAQVEIARFFKADELFG
jgi:nucleoside-diphosphate kinase